MDLFMPQNWSEALIIHAVTNFKELSTYLILPGAPSHSLDHEATFLYSIDDLPELSIRIWLDNSQRPVPRRLK
jgi:hypothetical protein